MLLVLIYIVCEYIWVIESFFSVLNLDLRHGILTKDIEKDRLTIYDDLYIGFDAISERIFSKVKSNIYRRG